MDTLDLLQAPLYTPRGTRAHRFMESSDIGAAFAGLFEPLRAGLQRGWTVDGQLFAIEVDPCLPGELLGAHWLPPAAHGLRPGRELASPARRRAVYARLLSEARPEALFAYACEQRGATLFVELASADGCHGAMFTIVPGAAGAVRDLRPAPHFRIGGPPRVAR